MSSSWDEKAFKKRWEEVYNNDPERKQHVEEYGRQWNEYYRLNQEADELLVKLIQASNEEERRVISRELEITQTKRGLAASRAVKAAAQRGQRAQELRLEMLGQITDAPTSELEQARRYIREKKEMVERFETQANEQEAKLNQGSSLSKRSQRLLSEALKAGYVRVITLVCIILGLPGVGKTLLKNLLLSKPPVPPALRSSTPCAEAPIRIEVRTVSGTRVRNEQGKWKEVDDDGMLDVVATMILSVEPEQTKPLGSNRSSEAQGTSKQKPRKSEGVFSRIMNWITKRNEKEVATKRVTPQEKSVAVASGQIASPGSLEACQKAMKKIMEKLVYRINKLRSGEQSASPVSSLPVTIWVYFTDSGGQPQYHELLPLFVRSISSAICVTRLTDKLDEVQVVDYYQDGKKVGASQHSQLSAKDTIRCLVNTIQSYSTQEEPPKIIMVGTHLDLLEKQLKPTPKAASRKACVDPISSGIETLEEKDKKLREMLEPEFSNQLVYSSSDLKKLLFTVDALNPGKREESVAQSVRHSVERSGAKEVEVPIWWYVLELLLQELAKELGRGVLSRAECLEMARLLNIEEDSFDAALEFLNKLNVIKYTPDVLPGVVFVDSQIPLSKVSELVQRSYKLRQPATSEPSSTVSPVDGMWKLFRDQGVVSEECLEEFQAHYFTGIFSKEDLSELLKSLLVFAEIPPPVKIQRAKRQKYYVMPALLETLLEAQLERHRVSSPSIATLIVRFPDRSRRAGVFCCFVVHLIKYYGWKLLLDSKEPLYRNCIKLQFLINVPTTVTVIDSNTYIEVHVDITAQASSMEYASATTLVRQAILNGIHAACIALTYKETVPELTFLCPHTGHPKGTKQHTATLTPNGRYWCCDLSPRLSGPLEPHHMIWFEDSRKSPSCAPSSFSGGRAEATTGSNSPLTAEGSIRSTKDETALDISTAETTSSANLTVSAEGEGRKIDDLVVPDSAAVSLSPPSEGRDVSASSPRATSPANTPVVPYDNQVASSPTAATPHPTDTHVATCLDNRVQLKHLKLIKWRGETERFYLMESISPNWRDIGELIGLPVSALRNIATEHRDKPLECCRAVLDHWLENPPKEYPITWKGLIELLKDCKLGQAVSELQSVLSETNLE